MAYDILVADVDSIVTSLPIREGSIPICKEIILKSSSEINERFFVLHMLVTAPHPMIQVFFMRYSYIVGRVVEESCVEGCDVRRTAHSTHIEGMRHS